MRKEKLKKNKRKNGSDGSRKSVRTNRRFQNGGSHGKRIKKGKDEKRGLSFPELKPWKVILGAIILGTLGIFYLNHVFATQKLLREVNQLEREYNRVKLMHSDYKLTYDRMIGPAEIYQKAQNQGFVNGGPAEKVIEVEK